MSPTQSQAGPRIGNEADAVVGLSIIRGFVIPGMRGILKGEFLSDSDRLETGLRLLWAELTPRCNLLCQHCYADSGPSLTEVPDIDWKKVLRESRQNGCSAVQLIGGEATLHPRFWQYVDYASHLGFEIVEVFSNLTTLDRAGACKLRDRNVLIATSFYSPSASVHDQITRRQGSFALTVRGIKAALDAGAHLRAGIVDVGINSSTIQDTITYLTNLGLSRSSIGVERIRAVGRGAAMAHGTSAEARTLCGHCWNGKLAVSGSGEVYPCVMARDMPVGNIRSSSISDILRSERLIGVRREIRARFPPETEWAQGCNPDLLRHGCNPDLLRHGYSGNTLEDRIGPESTIPRF
jgi:MoaA/NifB/PqqE/SkfB family radical SAM enzyme